MKSKKCIRQPRRGHMLRSTVRNKYNTMSHKRMALASIFLILVLWFVVSWLPVGILLAEWVELPTHAPARTVVSLSTFSQRVFNMRPTLDSIFEQSQFPDRVIITIPRKFRALEPTSASGWSDTFVDRKHHNETEQAMVAWFLDYMGYMDTTPVYRVNTNVHRTSYVYDMGVLTVQFLDDDWGPGTKLVGALLLETHPDTVVITLDDDMVYKMDTVQWLATHMQAGIALSFGCETWSLDRSYIHAFGMHSYLDSFMYTTRVCAGWLSGWTGVAYHVSSFGPDIWTFVQSLPVSCFKNDDMWLSAYVARQGVSTVVAPGILWHVSHVRDLKLSLSTIVDYQANRHSCARHLFS